MKPHALCCIVLLMFASEALATPHHPAPADTKLPIQPLPFPEASPAVSLEEQRLLFSHVWKKFDAIPDKKLQSSLTQLTGYPLLPYLRVRLLQKQLHQHKATGISQQFDRYADIPDTRRLHGQWLKQQYRARHYTAYLQSEDIFKHTGKHYKVMHINALWHTGDKQAAYAAFKALWLSGADIPNDLHLVFQHWKKKRAS